mmetsp:Transcript_20782/g.38670  ORF Transcript_20782/g.38670 Transcript_20782/m.38670 type:complete len:271 (-) Transcript_20782:183-995(-)
MKVRHMSSHVRLLALVDHFSVTQWGATFPLLDDTRVPRVSHTSLAKISANKKCVEVLVYGETLGLWKVEGVFLFVDKAHFDDVELAADIRVASARRKRENHAVNLFPWASIRLAVAVPHVLDAILFAELVQIQHGGPLGASRAVAVEGGPAPDPALVVLVGPKVVVQVVDLAHKRNLILGVKGGLKPVEERAVAGQRQRLVALLHPCQRLGVLHALQPLELVLGRAPPGGQLAQGRAHRRSHASGQPLRARLVPHACQHASSPPPRHAAS